MLSFFALAGILILLHHLSSSPNSFYLHSQHLVHSTWTPMLLLSAIWPHAKNLSPPLLLHYGPTSLMRTCSVLSHQGGSLNLPPSITWIPTSPLSAIWPHAKKLLFHLCSYTMEATSLMRTCTVLLHQGLSLNLPPSITWTPTFPLPAIWPHVKKSFYSSAPTLWNYLPEIMQYISFQCFYVVPCSSYPASFIVCLACVCFGLFCFFLVFLVFQSLQFIA